MALNPNHTLSNGHYRIIRLLGRGGFGFVYLAQDTLLAEEVAIKELIPALVGDEGMLKRFLAEAKATMRLTHKRIVRTHNVFNEGGNYYIVMEYMPGGSLEEHLREHGPLPVDEAVRIAAEVCEGLACAHEEGVVHCDLKPANILFDARGQAKVADFGIAHVSGEMLTRTWHTPAGFVAGTLPYMSPEQADGVRDDPRLDVYALGAVLYRMLTGRVYLDFDHRETPRAQMENLQRIYSQQPTPPSRYDTRIPTWLDAIILKALTKRPEGRYASADEMGMALLRIEKAAHGLAHQPVEVLPPTRLIGDQKEAPAAGVEPVSPIAVPEQQPGPQPDVHAEPRPARSEPRVPAAAPVFRPLPEDGKSVPPSVHRASKPVWFWPVAAAAGVLLILLIIAIGAALSSGEGAETADPWPTRAAVAAVTTVPSHTPTPTAVPKRTDTPRSIDTSLPLPTTNTPQPTATPTLTATFAPKALHAGATQTRSKDGMTMVYIPAGEFLMGSIETYDDEMPQHTVYLDAFWIDRTEVTNAQYRKCVEAEACLDPMDTGSYARSSPYRVREFDDHPVIEVHWRQANDYCQWAGARLPTEAEWEKAARGTEGHEYPWGDSAPDCSKAQYDECGEQTVPVGSKPAGASPYGALDMAGNVWEWVADWYDEDYYAASPKRNPRGPSSGEERVRRGGSWYHGQRSIRTATRADTDPYSSNKWTGFRCASSVPEH